MAADSSSTQNSVFAGSAAQKSTGAGNGGVLLRKPRMPAPRPPPRPVPAPSAGHQSYSYEQDVQSEDQSYSYFRQAHGDSPIPSVSPPPPSELYSRPQSTFYPSGPSTRKGLGSRKGDAKFVLDPSYRGNSNLGTYVEGRSLVRPFKPRGPDGLPMRLPRRNPDVILTSLDDFRYFEPPAFTLQDFMLRLTETAKVPFEKVQQVVLSRHNYKKMQKLIAEQCLPKSNGVTHTYFEPPEDLPQVSPRVPQHQLLVEMAALVKDQMCGVTQMEMKSIIRPLPRFSPDYKPDGSHPHTEILLYENDAKEKESILRQYRENSEVPATEKVIVGATAKIFHGGPRSQSPFAFVDDSMISPSELAILDTLMNGGQALSFKAHFIAQLPDIEPLSKTITYLNLSFNDFRGIPFEVFEISQLTVLKMRNNPITEIPAEIGRLRVLKTFDFSFCLVNTLPLNLFSLKHLEHLDFAYNRIDILPNEVKHLRRLRDLNMEGNQMTAMPAGTLRLKRLKHLRVQKNYMHPLFWKESSNNDPQRLVDLAALCFKRANLDTTCTQLPDHLQTLVHTYSKCDCCHGPLYGPGLRIIRPVSKIYGVRHLPILFRCCSRYCMSMFKGTDSHTLITMLYGDQQLN